MTGYRGLNIVLASEVVNCQSIPFCREFLDVDHAFTSFLISSIVPILLLPTHCAVSAESSISAMSSQLPCFGV